MSVRALPFLLALTLVPVAAAESTVEGWATFSSEVDLLGPARFESEGGALDLSKPTRDGAHLNLSWESATGPLVTVKWLVATAQQGVDLSRPGDVDKRRLQIGAATLVGVACEGTCQVVVFADPEDGGRLTLAGEAQGAVRWLQEPRTFWANWNKPHEDGFFRRFDLGTLVAGGDGFPVAEPRVAAEGKLGLFIENATLVFQTAQGERVMVDTSTSRSDVARLPGGARVEDVHSRFAYLEMEGARLALDAGEGASLLAPRLRVDLAGGSLSADEAKGHLTYDGLRATFAKEPLDLTGALTVGLRVVQNAGPGEGHELLHGESLRATFRGEATSVRAGSLRVETAGTADVSTTAAATLGFAILATLPWWLPRIVLAPLYSRIHRGSVLQNANRARIHHLIGQEPGRTPAEVARALGLARIVVRHHLRMLESHRLVLCRPDGRKRRYYLPDAPLGEASALQLLLRDGARRKVAEVLAASSTPLTQQEIAARTGFSPRLVSYHLGRLAGVDVVERHGARPAAYALRASAAALLREPPG